MAAPKPDPAARTEAAGLSAAQAFRTAPEDVDAADPVAGSDGADVSTAPAGQIIAGRFRLVRLIGRGGMGEVHEAEHIELARRVAVKIMHGRAAHNRTSVTRLKREARSLASLSHPNIVQVLDAGEHEGSPYIAMELLEGEDLRMRLDREGPLPVPDAIAIASQILAGLDAVHAAGVVHRDVKPENVFLTRSPDRALLVKLLDFGVSKLMSIDSSAGNLTESGTLVGSPAFMAPEQAIGSSGVDARTDLYAVGALLYTMLAGRPPFIAGNVPAVLLAIVEGRSEPLDLVRPGLPPALVQLVEKAMDKERGKRFRSAADLSAALQAVAPTGAHLAVIAGRRGRSRILLAGAVVAIALGGYALLRTPREHRSVEDDVAVSSSGAALVPPERDEPAPSKKAAPLVPRRARLRVEITPARAAASARITLGDRALAGPDVDLPVSERPHTLRVEAPGYAPFEQDVLVRSDVVVPVRLEPRRGGGRGGADIWQGPMKIHKSDPFR